MRYEVSRLYDRLVRFESLLAGLAGGKRSYPIHKKLRFGSSERTASFKDLNDWLVRRVELREGSKVLDAGCGVGQTLFDICGRRDVEGLGISVSEAEIEIARRASERYAVSDRCTFQVKSFDEKLEETYDLIIAIESIKHSADLRRTLTNLTGSLKDGGRLVIVEDFLKKEPDCVKMKREFLDYWSLHFLIDEVSCVDIMKGAGFRVGEVIDLTGFVRKKNRYLSALTMMLLSVVKRVIPFSPIRDVCSIFIGGVQLDRFYAGGFMEYKYIRFERADGS